MLERISLQNTCKITNIEYCGIENLWDLEIDSEDHIFYGNGIATSNSHAVSYAYLGYWSAFTKRSKPLEFYKQWLETSDHKLDPHAEVKNLVLSARTDDYEIEPPSVKYLTKGFFIKDGRVHFGLSHIKGSSSKELDKLFVLLTEHGVVLSIPSLLFDVLPHINKRTCEALINSGAFGYLGISRAKLSHWYTCSNMFTAKELEFFGNKSFQSFEEAILFSAKPKKEGGCVSTSARLLKVQQIVEVVLNPGRSLEDTPARIAALEEDLMGIPLSCSYMDACLAAGTADATCKDFKRGRTGRMSLNVRIKEVKEHVLKDDAKMAFVTAEDDSGELDNIVLFKDEYKKFGGLLYPGAFVALFGEKSKTKNSLVVSRVVEL